MSAPTVTAEPVQDLLTRVREGLLAASSAAGAQGLPGTDAAGQLLRPMVAFAGVRGEPPAGFWHAVLAVQLAHEASLLHDDVIDQAAVRRGQPTLATSRGVACALVQGDHLLTAAYRAAARTGSLQFVTLFARAVERTVAAEAAQGRAAGQVLTRAAYDEIALGKAGELLGCALASAAVLEGRADAGAVFELGRRLGLLYQMLDDLLDYCPQTDTGKPPLGDYAQGRWTWVLGHAPDLRFGADPAQAARALHRSTARGRPMARALTQLEAEARQLRAALSAHLPGDATTVGLVDDWIARAREAVAREAVVVETPAAVVPAAPEVDLAAALRARVPSLEAVDAYLATGSRSFRFASRLFSPDDAGRVARVYAWCRITDDLVDDPPAGVPAAELLDAWLALSRRAYEGHSTGLPLLDRVMGEMAAGGVPFRHAVQLVEGMRMDLRGERYATLAELRRYTFCVASTVGLWLTQLMGVDDAVVLERAERMGHAMQLTNILRDVGEDRANGRMYLPAELLAKHGITDAALARMCAGGTISAAWRALVEELMSVAEDDYRAALEAVPALPSSFARPVAVAAHVYRGIHREIRRNGYDNLRRRAHTRASDKVGLALAALWELFRASRGAASLGRSRTLQAGTWN
ncbi:squalene/phytoene synthase family protein [Longimicrobium sp.]|jgi:phytoene synthase|uniref:squalene/phytoene synthase family protein n=1 Tax=Longimicrobium sp. TaxID=2029185 RepID=UPI002F938B0F